MGILDSNQVKAENIKKKINIFRKAKLGGNLAQTIANQHEKDLYIEVDVVDSSEGNVIIQLSGTTYNGVVGNWLSAEFIANRAVSKSANSITLPTGKTLLKLPRSVSDGLQQIDIRLLISSANSEVTVNYYNQDSNVISDLNLSDYSVPVNLSNGKIYEVSVLSTENTSLSNYFALIAYNKLDVFVNDLLKVDGDKIVRDYGNVLQAGTKFYVNLVDSSEPYIKLLFQKNGNSKANVEIREIKSIPDFKENLALFTTNQSIGDAYFYKRKAKDKAIIATVNVTNLVAGNNHVNFFPRNFNGAQVEVLGKIVGLANNMSNEISINSVGKFDVIFDAPYDLDRINVSTNLVNGTEITVSFSSLDSKADTRISADTIYDSHDFKVEKYLDNVSNYASFENWEAILTGNILTISNGNTSNTVIITNLPNWKSGDSIEVMGFIPYKQGPYVNGGYSRETSTRLCLVTKLGNIYHNYPASNSDDSALVSLGMAKFDLSAIYQTVFSTASLSSERIPSKNSSLTTEQQKTHRYEPGLPDWNYNQHTANVGGFEDSAKTIAYGNGGHPPVLVKNGYTSIRIVEQFDYGINPQNSAFPHQLGGYLGEPFVVKSKMTTFTPYVGLNAKRNMILGTIDGGRTWYILNELGVGNFASKFGNNLDLSSIGAYVDGALSVSERQYIYPTTEDKDPENSFLYKSPISIASITSVGGKTTIVTNGAHGITDGSYIVFKKNTEGNYSYLANTVVDGVVADLESNDCGNGRFYAAKVLSSSSFEILQSMGGMDEAINAHHIHGGSTAKDGVIISCGEKYPNGWICYIPIHEIDDFESFNIWKYKETNPRIIRLNSTDISVQRPVGFLLNDDADQTFIFASDEAHIDRGFVEIEGREGVLKRNSAGLFKGKMFDIDDMSKSYPVLELEEACLGVIHKQGFYIVIGMSRNIYISKDLNNWAKIPLVSQYKGESLGGLFFKSGNTIYKIY